MRSCPPVSVIVPSSDTSNSISSGPGVAFAVETAQRKVPGVMPSARSVTVSVDAPAGVARHAGTRAPSTRAIAAPSTLAAGRRRRSVPRCVRALCTTAQRHRRLLLVGFACSSTAATVTLSRARAQRRDAGSQARDGPGARPRRRRYGPVMVLDRLDLTGEEFHRLTGWEIKPEGACKDDVASRCRRRCATPTGRSTWRRSPNGSGCRSPTTRRTACGRVGPESGTDACSTARACPRSCFPTSTGRPFDAREPARSQSAAARVGVLVRLPIRPARVAGPARGACARRPSRS